MVESVYAFMRLDGVLYCSWCRTAVPYLATTRDSDRLYRSDCSDERTISCTRKEMCARGLSHWRKNSINFD